MNTDAHRTPQSARKSVFYHDLATPVSGRKGRFSGSGRSARREQLGASDLPPPPMFTLDDRTDFSPECGIPDYPVSPEPRSEPRTPHDLSSRVKSEESPPVGASSGLKSRQSSGGRGWWSLAMSEGEGNGSPVNGVVERGALITLPPPQEVVRPEMKNTALASHMDLEEEEWVTVYGFSLGDTNLVMREFEKCGTILRHVAGPQDANWIHILYEDRCDARKALNKNGTQINGVLIVGVKPLDPMQRPYVRHKPNDSRAALFTPLPRPTPAAAAPVPAPIRHLTRPSPHAPSAVASPAKSIVSKIIDLILGV